MCAKTIVDNDFRNQNNDSFNKGNYTQVSGSEKPPESSADRNLVGFLVSY